MEAEFLGFQGKNYEFHKMTTKDMLALWVDIFTKQRNITFDRHVFLTCKHL